jgi:iron complex transport system permease protein
MKLLNRNRLLLILMIVLLFILVLISIGIGSTKIDFKAIFDAFYNYFISNNKDDINAKIILELRIPRIVLSGIVGAMLALSGLIYQTTLKNPLVEPFTLGISSGAAFGAALGIFITNFLIGVKLPLFVYTLIGGGISICIIFLVSLKKNVSMFTIIFVGVIISSFFNSGLTLLIFMLGNRMHEVLFWTMGSFANIPDMPMFIFVVCISLVSFIIIFILHRQLDIFYFSDNLIKNMGVDPNKMRGLLFFVCSVPVIICISISGIIGFVGLIVPHIARFLFGNRNKVLIPASAIIGAGLLIASDDISRSLLSLFSNYGQEIPIGVITSIIGSPVFLYYLLKERKSL